MRYPREIKGRPGKRLMFLIAAIHMVAAISFSHLDFGSPWVLAASAALGLSLVLSVRAERRRCSLRFVLEDCGALRVQRGDFESMGRPLPSCVDFGWAVWLVWSSVDNGCKRDAILILRADVPRDDWRALRIWLRHKAQQDVSGELSEA